MDARTRSPRRSFLRPGAWMALTVCVAAALLGLWLMLPAQPAIGVSVEVAFASDDPPAGSPEDWRVVRLQVPDAPLPLRAFLALLPYDWGAVMAGPAPPPRGGLNPLPPPP